MKPRQSDDPLRKTGVYRISTPAINDLVYIGSAARSIHRRWIVHKSDLQRAVHHSRRLLAVTQKFGMSILEFEVLEFCDPENCIAVEQQYIDQHPRHLLYNTNPIAGSRRGAKLTKEQRKLLSLRHGGISLESDLAKIISEYAEGATQTELAAKFGVDRSSSATT